MRHKHYRLYRLLLQHHFRPGQHFGLQHPSNRSGLVFFFNFFFAFPVIWSIDTFGCRSLLLFTFLNMAWSLLAAGLCTLIKFPEHGSGVHLGLMALYIYIFGARRGSCPLNVQRRGVLPLPPRGRNGLAVATSLKSHSLKYWHRWVSWASSVYTPGSTSSSLP